MLAGPANYIMPVHFIFRFSLDKQPHLEHSIANPMINFVKTPNRISGNRIYGRDGRPLLLIEGNWVLNGDWDVEWMNIDQTVGRCKSNPGVLFEYMFHAPDGNLDYNEVLFAAKESVKANGKVCDAEGQR